MRRGNPLGILLSLIIGMAVLTSTGHAQDTQKAKKDRPVAAPKPFREVIGMTLEETIKRALQKSKLLEAKKIEAQIKLAARRSQGGAFDLMWGGSTSASLIRQPSLILNPIVAAFKGVGLGTVVDQSKSITIGTSLEKLFKSGTTTSLTFSQPKLWRRATGAVNPLYTPEISLEIRQPLLKGFGREVTTADFESALHEAHIARLDTSEQAQDLVRDVVTAYWTYVLTREDLVVKRQALETAESLLELNRRKRDAGMLTDTDVLAAETGVATRRESVIVAQGEQAKARFTLLRYLEPSDPRKGWNIDFVPLDKPEPKNKASSLDTALDDGFNRGRKQFEHRLSQHTIKIRKAENQLLPQLDLVGNFTYHGIGRSQSEAWRELGSGDFYTATGALEFGWPIPNTTAQANMKIELLAERGTVASRIAERAQNILNVRIAWQDVTSARERIKATKTAVKLAERQLTNEQSRLLNGLSTSHAVLEIEEDVTEARANAIRAKIDLLLAQARLQRARGTILSTYDIRIGPRTSVGN